MTPASTRGPRWWVPEVIQTSETDCGPACMASFLAGFGLEIPYASLRDVCLTDADGTSIDDMEDVAVSFGLDAAQTVAPAEHVVSAGAALLPAIAVLALSSGVAHFVVVWRRVGPWFQVMDPLIGRRWMHRDDLAEQLMRHEVPLPAQAWRDWAESQSNLAPLTDRLRRLGVSAEAVDSLLHEAVDDSSWHSLAALEGLIRLAEAADPSRGRVGRSEAASILEGLAGRSQLAVQYALLPASLRGVRAGEEEAQIVLTGAVLVTASACRLPAEPPVPDSGGSALMALATYVKQDGVTPALVLLGAAGLTAAATAFEALLFRGILATEHVLHTYSQRMAAVGMVTLFSTALLLLELGRTAGVRTLGRRLEVRVRSDFLRKLVRLPDLYFASRLVSDLSLRIHAVVQLRSLPFVADAAIRTLLTLGCTTAGIIWLDPACGPYAIIAVVLSVVLPLGLQSRLGELQMMAETYRAGLSRTLLDALRGAVPLRAHSGQAALRTDYDRQLDRWAGARRRLIETAVLVDAVLYATGALLLVLLLDAHVRGSDASATLLLLGFWASQLPTLGRELAVSILVYPARRAVALRVLETIRAPDEPVESSVARSTQGGVALSFCGAGLRIGRTSLIEPFDAEIAPGTHVAVVGASGAGKSSLLGLVLGWNRPSVGSILVNGVPQPRPAHRLTDAIAWIDPQVQLWNRSLHDNLLFGNEADLDTLAQVIDVCGLRPVVDALPAGLGTPLGEDGRALSQGEAQRVRVARAMLRRHASLVLLDEPFRGLDRRTRRNMMHLVREWWPHATLLAVTHDLTDTRAFDEVWVFAHGALVERGSPGSLEADSGSRYAQMLADERRVRRFLDDDPGWTRWTMEEGSVRVRVGDSRVARAVEARG